MDDRTKGLGDERMRGVGDDETIGRSEESVPRRRTPTSSTAAGERAKGWSDDRTRGASTTVDSTDLDDAAEVKTEQIRAEIERTRDDMSETIDAIQDRLQPRTIAANAAASVRDAASNAVSNVRNAASETIDEVADSRIVQEVRSNPIPATMVGIGVVGLAWLAFGGRRARSRRYRTEVFDHGRSSGYYERDDYYRQRAASPRGYESASAYTPGPSDEERMGSATGRDIVSKASEYGRDAAWRARQTTRRAQNQLQRAMNQNPLFVGAAALAVGAAIGMAFPETERENELMGETRDSLVEGAQEMARDAASRVQEVATEAAKRVQDVATDAVGSTGKGTSLPGKGTNL